MKNTGVQRKHRLHQDELTPPGACVPCTSALLAAAQFRSLVLNSHSLWQRAVTSLHQISSPAPLTKSLYVFLQQNTLSIQTVQDFGGGDPKVILNRFAAKSPEKKQSSKKPRIVRSGPTCSCSDCGQVFNSPYYLHIHLRNSGQKEACLICGNIIPRGNDMKEHMSLVHKRLIVLCNSCPSMFETEIELKKHVRTAHKSGALTCTDCGRSFTRSAAFEAHLQMHTVRTCRSCGIQFSNRSCYRRHRAQCEPDAKPDKKNLSRIKRSNIRDPASFICDYCGKEYNSRPQLKNHIIWIHMDVRPHQCQWCGKRFYTPARLAEHTVVHTRARNFSCDICGVKLVSKMAVVYHRRRHTGERPYECMDCGERFISSSRRSEHAKRRHNKGTKFECPQAQCAASFVRSLELRKHVEKMHKNLNVVVEKRRPKIVALLENVANALPQQ